VSKFLRIYHRIVMWPISEIATPFNVVLWHMMVAGLLLLFLLVVTNELFGWAAALPF
jgi:hypothetical protein